MDRQRMATLALAVLGALLLANGVIMIAATAPWFAAVAKETGPLNEHLVRDVGAAYVATGAALLWAAFAPAQRRALSAVAAVFLVLHALGHVVEIATGRLGAHHWLEDLPGVFLPALVTLLVAATTRGAPPAHAPR